MAPIPKINHINPSLRFLMYCDYLNKSECEVVLTRDNTKTSSIFSYINKKIELYMTFTRPFVISG